MALLTSFSSTAAGAPPSFDSRVDDHTLFTLAAGDWQAVAPGVVRIDTGDTVVRLLGTGFTLGPAGFTGTVTGIEVEDGPTGRMEGSLSGISLGVANLLALARDGDLTGFHALLYGGDDTMQGGGGADTLTGGGGRDRLLGNNGADALFGEAGADTLDGGAGADLLAGGLGTDQLIGGLGADSLSGGAGADWLEGNAGADTLLGGGGADTFIYRAAGESGPTVASRDVILGFSAAEGDRISLAPMDADATLAGNQAFAFIGADAFAPNAPGTLRHELATGGFILHGNTDSDAEVEFSVVVIGFATPQASDLVL